MSTLLLAKTLPAALACELLQLSRSTFYRRLACDGEHKPAPGQTNLPRCVPAQPQAAETEEVSMEADLQELEQVELTLDMEDAALLSQQEEPQVLLGQRTKHPRVSARGLSPQEQDKVMEVLTSERFMDKTPRDIWSTLLEENQYLCHWRTMYRLMAKKHPVLDRRPQRRHPKRAAPELRAAGPNQVWSWDISYLPLPGRGQFAYLYTIIDIYSRCVVGWTVHESEDGEVAARLIETSCERHGIEKGELILHADRGSVMKCEVVKKLLERRGVQRSHSRPRVSNDNAFIESFFKTVKYSPKYPGVFENVEEARSWSRGFTEDYNHHHRHSGLGLLTPAQVHLGLVEQVQEQRKKVLTEAVQRHPLRFKNQKFSLPGPAKEVRLGFALKPSTPQPETSS